MSWRSSVNRERKKQRETLIAPFVCHSITLYWISSFICIWNSHPSICGRLQMCLWRLFSSCDWRKSLYKDGKYEFNRSENRNFNVKKRWKTIESSGKLLLRTFGLPSSVRDEEKLLKCRKQLTRRNTLNLILKITKSREKSRKSCWIEISFQALKFFFVRCCRSEKVNREKFLSLRRKLVLSNSKLRARLCECC